VTGPDGEQDVGYSRLDHGAAAHVAVIDGPARESPDWARPASALVWSTALSRRPGSGGCHAGHARATARRIGAGTQA
jgi:hypothetical protein